MRGKGPLEIGTECAVRITPAYAGKSTKSRSAIRLKWDHPRVCGEKLYTPCVIAPSVGSPPRMRGKDKVNLKFSDPAWITPAYAGKSAVAIIR